MDEEKKWFLRGLLAAFASNGQIVHYDEIRRLARLKREQLGEYLDQARKDLRKEEPDFCSVVVADTGFPGSGWGSHDDWPGSLREAHRYWRDRRLLDNDDFKNKWGKLPTFPSTRSERDGLA